MALESVIPNEETSVNDISHNQRKYALTDLLSGFAHWRIWLMLAYQDIKIRYRRSVLGPFWITLSMAITVYSMGYLYSHLFHIDLEIYFPFLVAGMLSWTLLSTTIMDLTDTFTNSDGLLKQIKLPFSVHIHRIITRNLLIFFHNIIVIVPILIFFHKVARIDLYTLMLIPALLIFYFNCITYGLVLAIIGTRYRDISQIIKSLMNVIMYLTPIMWNPIVLPAKDQLIIRFNPFYACVEILRAPLLGAPIMSWVYLVVGIVTVVGIFLCMALFPRYRARIIYWL